MKKYRVETDKIAGINKGQEVSLSDDWCAYGIKWGTFAQIKERNPEWFSPVEEEVKEGDWVYDSLNRLFRVTEIIDKGFYRQGYGHKPDGSDYNEKFSGIKRKATPDEIETALIAEAKRRYDDSDKILDARYERNKYEISNLSNFYYQEKYDALCGMGAGNGTVYCKGNWAEPIVDEPIQINGYEVDFLEPHDNRREISQFIKVGCSEIYKDVFIDLNRYAKEYDLSIYREGENITKQIKQIADKL